MSTHINKLSTLETFIDKYKQDITDVKVTHILRGTFNCYGGYQYQVYFKVFTSEKFRDRLLVWDTNSTYLDDFLPEDINPKTEKEYNEQVTESLYDCLCGIMPIEG